MGLDTRIGCVIQNNKKARDYLLTLNDIHVIYGHHVSGHRNRITNLTYCTARDDIEGSGTRQIDWL